MTYSIFSQMQLSVSVMVRQDLVLPFDVMVLGWVLQELWMARRYIRPKEAETRAIIIALTEAKAHGFS